jgi:endonuclease-8
MVARLRAADQRRELGDALLSQRLVAGIGNMWKAEGLFRAGLSPWRTLEDVSDEELALVLGETACLMQAGRKDHAVYRMAGRACRVCGDRIESWPQGDHARMAYWCPGCQPGPARGKRARRVAEAGTAGDNA